MATLALLAPLAGVVGLGTPTPAARAADPEPDPLRLMIEQVQPAVLTDESEVTISGIITNDSNEVWTGVNVAPLRSAYPIRDRASLAEAARTPVDAYVGDRLTDVEAITTLDSLAPGSSASFTTRIPRSALGATAGVYWIGVHASGETATRPRDQVADGRGRTFLPVASAGARPQRTSFVVPVRATVRHTADGRVDDVRSWTASLSPGGQLHQVLVAAEASGETPVAWLVDPAVPDAVRHLAAGNPAWRLQPAAVASPPADDQVTPTDGTSTDADPEVRTHEEQGWGDETVAAARAARDWLEMFTRVLSGEDVYALPYGDGDVISLTRHAPTLMARARTRSTEVLEELGVPSTPVVAPYDGRVDEQTVASTDPGTVVLLQDSGLVAASGTVPSVGTLLGRPYAASSSGAAQGGPGPGAAGDPLAVRQRVASEAVLKELAGDRSPLVVVPPRDWNAGTGVRELVRLASTEVVRVVPLNRALYTSDTTLSGASLRTPSTAGRARVPEANVRAAQDMTEPAVLLEAVLERPAGVDEQVADVALASLAQTTRRTPRALRRQMRATTEHLHGMLGKIQISGPAVATISGASGRIGATLTNSLDVPVTVDVEAVTAGSLEIDAPDRVTLAPESRRRLLLQATQAQQGVQSVTLRVTTPDGRVLGSEATFGVRSSEVTGILWLIMGSGAVVLFGTIAVRLFRRGLASRRQQGVEAETTDTDDTADSTGTSTQGVTDAAEESHE